MSMTVLGYKFEGPFSLENTVVPVNRAAVYVIIFKAPDGQFYIEDVGITNETNWARNNDGTRELYLRYMPSIEGFTANDRETLAGKIKYSYRLP